MHLNIKRISPVKSSFSEKSSDAGAPFKWAYAVKYEIVTFSVRNYTESTDRSQNIVEQANSYPNNTSLTVSRRHIICNSSIFTEWTSRFTPSKIRTYSEVEVDKYNKSEESKILAVFPT